METTTRSSLMSDPDFGSYYELVRLEVERLLGCMKVALNYLLTTPGQKAYLFDFVRGTYNDGISINDAAMNWFDTYVGKQSVSRRTENWKRLPPI